MNMPMPVCWDDIKDDPAGFISQLGECVDEINWELKGLVEVLYLAPVQYAQVLKAMISLEPMGTAGDIKSFALSKIGLTTSAGEVLVVKEPKLESGKWSVGCSKDILDFKAVPRTVKEIVSAWLVAHGYTGLYSDDCGCELSDLMPCSGESCDQCAPGYKGKCGCVGPDLEDSVCEEHEEADNAKD